MSFSANVSFPSQGDSTGASSYRLIELPPDILKLFEQNDLPPSSLTIKGRSDDEAVLCTPTSTYAIRSIAVSNTIAIMTSPINPYGREQILPSTPVGSMPGVGEHNLVIRDQLHEFLELIPTMPRLGQLHELLQGTEYDEEDTNDGDVSSASRRRVTYEQVKNRVQASDQELSDGLRKARVITLNGALRTLSMSQLSSLLQNILNTLVAEGLSTFVPLADLHNALLREDGVLSEITDQLVKWFGLCEAGLWEPDFEEISKVIGLSLLSENKNASVDEVTFLDRWRVAVGDSFEEHVRLALLTGNYLSSALDSSATSNTPALWYFPSAELPSTPAERFKDLFLTRTRWRADDIIPFINDLTVDTKGRDKLLLKFCRAFTDENGQVWYTGRGNY